MINSRDIAGVQQNHISPKTFLDHNRHKIDNQFDMSRDDVMQVDKNGVENNSDLDNTLNTGLCHLYDLPIESESLGI